MYFSKIEFQERRPDNIYTYLSLNLTSKEIAYNVIRYTHTSSAVIQKLQTTQFRDLTVSSEATSAAKYLASGKSDFKPELLITEEDKEEVLFSYAEKFTDAQLKKLLPYCKVSAFEPYRNRSFLTSDKCTAGYYDEISLNFRGVSNSPVPYIEISMDIITYDNHTLPTTKLYEYIFNNFFIVNKEVYRWMCR
ncbi:MAG: hypothetical protein IJ298_00370 [Ruminococcus sp.]|nr:hypothetical protein [Ruminococcus sp.]